MKKITFRIWVLIIILVFSLIAIFGIPPKIFQKGVIITSVESNSTAFNAGLRPGQIIISIDNTKISSVSDFTNALKDKYPSEEKIKTVIKTNEIEAILFTNSSPEITVSDIPKTNIKTGLDLAGGARALVKAENKSLNSNEIADLIAVISNRLNTYGIKDVKVLPISDLSGNNYVLIEIAGTTPEDLKDLISQQGKFEAKIANKTVFIGGEKDIASVCRNDASCAGIERCSQTSGGYACRFRFGITLSENAAKKHAEATQNLSVNVTPQGNYLSEKLDLYVDDKLLSSLLIGESLKGQVTTQIEISGSGVGETREEAYNDAESEMRKLQTILITGSLPYKLEIVKLDTISPTLGQEFIKTILLAGIAAIVAVAIIVFIRYKKIKSSLALIITSISEITIILGVASFIKWNLDLPSIAGILATIGTGIDSQIIVLDEARQTTFLSLKQKLKRAFAIILGAYFTSLASLLPLMRAGAGLLKGFAITTIIGITVGVLITRPAFADMIKNIGE